MKRLVVLSAPMLLGMAVIVVLFAAGGAQQASAGCQPQPAPAGIPVAGPAGSVTVVGPVSTFGPPLEPAGATASQNPGGDAAAGVSLHILNPPSSFGDPVNRALLGHLFRVTIQGHTAVLPDIDLGPADYLHRAIDVTGAGAAAMGLPQQSFPTGAAGTAVEVSGAAAAAVPVSACVPAAGAGSVLAAYQDAQALSAKNLIYTRAVRTLLPLAQVPAGATMYDCSASVSEVLALAGFPLPGGVTVGQWAPVSGSFMPGAAGLLPGPGQEMTIWADAQHMFIELNIPGVGHFQGNTANPYGGFRLYPWSSTVSGGWGGPSPGSAGAPAFTASHYPGT